MDIDIDFQPSFEPNSLFKKAIRASMVKDEKLQKHPCGYYLQSMPVDKLTNLAAIPHDTAEAFGFTKIDFLHLNLLNKLTSKEEVRELIDTEPNWKLLENPIVVSTLFQLSKHFELLQRIRPKNVEELADCVAMIRPNKKHLVDEYLNNKNQTRPKLYKSQRDDKSAFRKCHAIAYALTIVLQLHLIQQGKISLTTETGNENV